MSHARQTSAAQELLAVTHSTIDLQRALERVAMARNALGGTKSAIVHTGPEGCVAVVRAHAGSRMALKDSAATTQNHTHTGGTVAMRTVCSLLLMYVRHRRVCHDHKLLSVSEFANGE